jgi:D-arabinose 5-phosphate isomerase GutQ
MTMITRKQKVRIAKPTDIVIAVPQKEARCSLSTVDAKDAMRHKSHH